jgi:hypothetical protein
MLHARIPELYPKPIYFHQSRHFSGERHFPIDTPFDRERFIFFGADENAKARILSQLETVKFRYIGRLAGEYLIIQRGLLAMDRHGTVIKLNSSADDDWVHPSFFNQVEESCGSADFDTFRTSVMQNWDSFQEVSANSVIYEVHASHNYYHFHIRLLPKFRMLQNNESSVSVIPGDCMNRPYQKELLLACLGERKLLPVGSPVRVKDPIIIQEPFCIEAMQWLRERVGLHARRGTRKIYITRHLSLSKRRHGQIDESEDFLRFLKDRNFEFVDFGAGEMSVANQISLLDGAGIVLGGHGANLTNLAYADPDICLVEMLPYYWSQCSYMQIAAVASLNYFGVICHEIDEDKRIIVDLDSLNAVLAAAEQRM